MLWVLASSVGILGSRPKKYHVDLERAVTRCLSKNKSKFEHLLSLRLLTLQLKKIKTSTKKKDATEQAVGGSTTCPTKAIGFLVSRDHVHDTEG